MFVAVDFGIAPAISLVALFVLYLSLTIADKSFSNFQWTCFAGDVFFIDLFWRRGGCGQGNFRCGRISDPASAPVSKLVFLLSFLLFKLMLMSA